MLINFSNHPSKGWDAKQNNSAIQLYGDIIDLEFPEVHAEMSKEGIVELAQIYVREIIKKNPEAVHIMGELNFTFICVQLLKSYDIKCLASTSARIVSLNGNVKSAKFEFVQFREY